MGNIRVSQPLTDTIPIPRAFLTANGEIMTQLPHAECHFLTLADLQVFERLNSPIWVYDVQQNQVLWANLAALQSWEVSSIAAIHTNRGASENRVKLEVCHLRSEQIQRLGEEKISFNWTITHPEKRLMFSGLCSNIDLEGYESAVLVEATTGSRTSDQSNFISSSSGIPYQQIVESSNEGIWVINSDAITTYVNREMARRLGYSVAQMLGRSIFEFMDETWRQYGEALKPNPTEGIAKHYNFCFQRADRSPLWAEVSTTPLWDETSNDCVGVIIVNDINDRVWTQLQLQEQIAILEAIATHQPLEEILRQLIQTVETLIPNRIASFLLYDPKKNCLGSGEALSLPPDYTQALEGLRLDENAGCCGTAAYRKEPVIVSDIASDPLWEEFRDLALSCHLRAAWSYPILGEKGTLLGTFCCYSQRVEEPTERDLQLTNMVSHLAALAISQDQVKQERNQKLALVEAAVDGIAIVEEGRFCYLNQAHAEIFGYEASGELMAVHWQELYPPQEAARLEQEVMPILLEQGHWQGNAIAKRKDGTTFPEEISLTLVEPEKIICVCRDISDRAAAESALQESEQRYQLAAEGAKVGVWDWNLERDELYIASNLKNLLGYADHELSNLTDNWSQLVHPDDVEKVKVAFNHYMTGKTSIFEVEHRMMHKNGDMIWILARGQAQRNAQGEIYRMIGSDTDITARKEAELAEQEARAAQQERDRYLHSLTHIQQKLLSASELTLAVYQDLLNILGETAQASRCYFFTIDCHQPGICLATQQGEWCAQGVTPETDNSELQDLPLAETMPLLMETLFAKEVYSHHVVNLPPYDREHLEPQGIQSILVFPLFVNDQLFGFIGWDQCDCQREWTELEINFLRWATNSIAIAQEKQQSQQALLESEKKYRSIFENITQGIFQASFDGRYLSANPFLANLYGYDSPKNLIKSIRNIPEQLYVNPDRCYKLAQLTLGYGTVKNFESQVYRKDGTIIWISLTQHAVYDTAGHFLYFEGVIEDITARKAAEDQLYYQAFHDGLTQLSNRTWFVQRLEKAIYAYENGLSEHCYAVFFIDLDRFKMINDSLGHITGDELLKQVAHRLESVTAKADLIARFGGDEFALLSTHIQSHEDCAMIAQKLLDAFTDPFYLQGNRYFIGASIGIALGDFYYNTPEELLRDADAAMYEAKAKGGGYMFFQPHIRERILSCLLLENDLEGAIQRNEFQLYYQPLVYLETNQLYGFEVLLRWLHPQRGAISPSEFIPLAEQTGVIKELDAWVFQQSCRQLRQWQNQFTGAQDLVLSVNLSPVELLQPNLVQQIADTLQAEGIAPHCIRLELTETAFLDDTRLEVFQQLHTLGVQISIDDFGTGESSLSRLHQLPISTIKVDQEFVQKLDQGYSGAALVQAILNLAHNLDINTLSEGIETSQQRDTLLRLGCSLGQGYFYSPPVPVRVATTMLAEGNLSRFISDIDSDPPSNP